MQGVLKGYGVPWLRRRGRLQTTIGKENPSLSRGGALGQPATLEAFVPGTLGLAIKGGGGGLRCDGPPSDMRRPDVLGASDACGYDKNGQGKCWERGGARGDLIRVGAKKQANSLYRHLGDKTTPKTAEYTFLVRRRILIFALRGTECRVLGDAQRMAVVKVGGGVRARRLVPST